MAASCCASLRYRPGEAAAVARALVGDGDAGKVGIEADALAAAREAIGDGPVTVVLGRPSLAESAASVAEAERFAAPEDI